MDTANTPVVIMAGGKGERMKPFSDVLPKPLLLYHGRTMIENVLMQFYEKGFRKFYFILCNQGDLISTYLEKIKRDCEMHYSYEETPLGTAGGLWMLQDELQDDFILCNCDNLGHFDYGGAISFHKKEHADITMLVKRQRYEIPFGLVETDGSKRVKRVEEKPMRESYISVGMYVVSPQVVRSALKGHQLDMPSLINLTTANKGKVCFWDIKDEEWIDMSIDGFPGMA